MNNLEQTLLGSLLTRKENYLLIAGFFTKSELHSPEAKKIYQVIADLVKENKEVDIPVVASILSKGNDDLSMTYTETLLRCQFACPNASNIKEYAKQIQEMNVRSKLREIAHGTLEKVSDPRCETREIQGYVTGAIAHINEEQTPTQSIPVHVAVDHYIEQYYKIIDKENLAETRTFYGITELDEVTSGIAPNEFIVIAARTNVGKSILALNLHYNIAKQKKKVLYCSIEMSKEQITSRLLSRITAIPQVRFQKYQLTEKEYGLIGEAYEELQGYDMHFLTKGELTIEDILLELIKNQMQQYDVVIVDYVQIMTHGDYKQGMTEKVTQLSHALKQLAQEYGTAIIGVAQLNREAVKDSMPEIHHLQNSGALEQDAEVVVLLHRDPEDPMCVEGKRMFLLLRKNRKGHNNLNIQLPTDLSRMYIAHQSDF